VRLQQRQRHLGAEHLRGGSIPALGSWNTGAALLLSSASYPLWSLTLDLPVSTYVEYKYIKKDDSGTVAWESGSNRTFTTPASGSTTRNDTWK
jgi:alpha-amylase